MGVPNPITFCFHLVAGAGRFALMVVRLVLFATCLLPGFIRVGLWYLKGSNVMRNVKYGDRGRNYLDVYAPPKKTDGSGTGHPVMIFISGGAWMIGNKAWGALLGKVLKDQQILCVMPDYRNFPQGRVTDMLDDVKAAVAWTFANCYKLGGDPNRIFLVGQSAGAHLSAVALLQQAKLEKASDEGTSDTFPSWRSSHLAGFIGISGPYDLMLEREFLATKGLEGASFLTNIMGGKGSSQLSEKEKEEKLKEFSPVYRMRGKTFFHRLSATSKLPPINLLHGTADATVPDESSKDFGRALTEAGCRNVDVKFYTGKSHTDPIIEDLLFDDEGGVITDIIAAVHRQGGPGLEQAGAAGAAGGGSSSRKRRSPSMLYDGFGVVDDRRSRTTGKGGAASASGNKEAGGGLGSGSEEPPSSTLVQRAWGVAARVMVGLARVANPF